MDYYKPFAKAVDYVLEMNFSSKPQWGAPAAYNAYPLPVPHDVVVRVGIIGAIEGVMAIVLRQKTAISIATTYGGARQASHVNKEVESLLREFINMASGNAIARLAEQGDICDITTPEVITGNTLAVHCTPPVRTAALPFTLNKQELLLLLTLRRTTNDASEPMAWRVF